MFAVKNMLNSTRPKIFYKRNTTTFSWLAEILELRKGLIILIAIEEIIFISTGLYDNIHKYDERKWNIKSVRYWYHLLVKKLQHLEDNWIFLVIGVQQAKIILVHPKC